MPAGQATTQLDHPARKRNFLRRRQGWLLSLGSALGLVLFAQTPSTQHPTPGDTALAERFQTFGIMDDPRHVGGEAYRILVPAGWRIEGSVMWKNSGADPAAPWIKLVGPAHQEIGILPPTTFVWNPALGPSFHPGTFFNGIEVQPPMLDPAECIKSIIIPRYRRNLDNADVVKQEALPALAEAARLKYSQPQYQNAAFRAGKMRFAYVENGVPMEEDVYVLTTAVQFRAGQSVGTVWQPDEIRYSKAPKGTLDGQLPLLETALFSLRPNLAWWARVQEVSQELGRLQAQFGSTAAGRAVEQQAAAADRAYTDRKLAESGKPISDTLLKAYQDRQAVMDRINEHWENTAQEVERYRNPASGESLALPAGFSAGWVNKNGDYLVSRSSNYDPNAGSNGGWSRLEKVHP